MTEQPKRKVKKFAPKGGPTIAQSSKKRSQVPIRSTLNTPQGTPPPAKPVPVPSAESTQENLPPIPLERKPVDVPQPVALPEPIPVPEIIPLPEPVRPPIQLPTPIPTPVPTPVQVPSSQPTPHPMPSPIPARIPQATPPPLVPQQTPMAAAPPVINLNQNEESINAPTHIQQPEQALESKEKTHEKTSQNKIFQGKPVNQTESEDFKDEVASYLEVCDSCLCDKNSPKEIVDVLHMLVRSLNFDVVTIALLDEKRENLISEIASRGYDNPPSRSVVNCWEKAILKGKGLDWKVLMKIAGDNQIDLAYWIVQEGLDSIGYVPIRDSQTIYGFIFVASMEKKTQSPLSSLLLDACGSRIGIANSLNANKGDWPENVLHLAKDIRNQFSLLMGYTEMLRESATLSPEQISEIIENCNKTIIESTQMLDSMTSEALGD